MAEKILVADDSLTIQKVIAITLANTDYELVECLSHKDLISNLESDNFDLVLLDFNLSDSKTGYELGKEIKAVSPDVSILAMLGTFDTVDEGDLLDAGIRDKIVKPFESEKFIQKCNSLIDDKGESVEVNLDSSDEFEEIEETQEDETDDIGSDWVVDSPKPADDSSVSLNETDQVPVKEEFSNDVAQDALSQEMNSWGIEVPGVIGEEKDFGIFPPKIEAQEDAPTEDEALPNDNDLAYPAFDSLDDLHDEDEDLDATDPSFQMPEDFNDSVDLSAEIEEELDGDDFWAVDAEESGDIVDEPSDVSTDIDELDDIEEGEVDQIFADLENEIDSEKESYNVEEVQATTTPAANIEFDSDEIISEVKEAITPVLEELVKKFCKEKIEQVAWEVIPDLAENLIKKEIKDISESLEN